MALLVPAIWEVRNSAMEQGKHVPGLLVHTWRWVCRGYANDTILFLALSVLTPVARCLSAQHRLVDVRPPTSNSAIAYRSARIHISVLLWPSTVRETYDPPSDGSDVIVRAPTGSMPHLSLPVIAVRKFPMTRVPMASHERRCTF
jgi:hypothetical protein